MNVLLILTPFVLLTALVGAKALSSRTWSLKQFTSYVAGVMRRNLPLGSSLSAYVQDMPVMEFRKRRALIEIADFVDNGGFFADALDLHAGIFPAHYRALVRAGENGGNLARVLERLVDTVGFEERTARRASGYAVYPALVSFFVLGLILLQRASLWQAFPWMMRTGLASGTQPSMRLAMRTPAFIAPVALVLVLVAMKDPLKAVLLRHTSLDFLGRAWSWLLWHVPLWSKYERRRAVSQYAFAAASLMDAGVPEHEALVVAASASANHHFDSMARSAADRVAEGERLSRAFRSLERSGELPPEFVWYLEVGEESSRLPEALRRASESAEARAKSAMTRLTSLILPVGVALVGVVVAIVVYSIFDTVWTVERFVIEAGPFGR